jgi:hypothetical protein
MPSAHLDDDRSSAPDLSEVRFTHPSSLLNLGMIYCNSAFNAQGSRGIKIAVDVGIVKIYVAAMEALRKKERQGETQFTIKIDDFLSFTSPPLLVEC